MTALLLFGVWSVMAVAFLLLAAKGMNGDRGCGVLLGTLGIMAAGVIATALVMRT